VAGDVAEIKDSGSCLAGVIFDFNGVLFWDNPLHEEAWRQYSARLRGWPLDQREMVEQVHGKVNRDIFAYVLGAPPADKALARLVEEKETIYRRLCLAAGEAFRLSPGAVELLDSLAAHDVPRAIATSSPWVNLAFYIEHLALHRWFEPARLIHDRGRYPGKPAPDIYLEAAEALSLPPASCAVVEDSLAGIAAARAAGIGRIVALGPAERHAELAALPGVTDVVVDLGHFPHHLLAAF
jgi:HAD superfamily hydrolase (TIGR01509 family)